jgi:hypothetical protein
VVDPVVPLPELFESPEAVTPEPIPKPGIGRGRLFGKGVGKPWGGSILGNGVGVNGVPPPPPDPEGVFELEDEEPVGETFPADKVEDKLSGKLGAPPVGLAKLIFPDAKGRAVKFPVVFPPEELGLEK